MAKIDKTYFNLLPSLPKLNRKAFRLPESYVNAYSNNGITESKKQLFLFYGTQFGGFKLNLNSSYLRFNKEFLNAWFEIKQETNKLVFKANPKFISSFGNLKPEFLLRRTADEEYFKERGWDYQNIFSEDEKKEIKLFLNDLNQYYFSNIELSLPNIASGISLKEKLDLGRFHAIPHLQWRPKAGGRFFHTGKGYQNLSKNLRQFLRINGENVSEIDLNAAVLQFLYIGSNKYFSSHSSSEDDLLEKKQKILGILSKDKDMLNELKNKYAFFKNEDYLAKTFIQLFQFFCKKNRHLANEDILKLELPKNTPLSVFYDSLNQLAKLKYSTHIWFDKERDSKDALDELLKLEKIDKKHSFKDIVSQRDPYEFFLARLNSEEFQNKHKEETKIERDSLKELIYTLVYSSYEKQKNHVNRKLRLQKRNFTHDDFMTEFPQLDNLINRFSSLNIETYNILGIKEIKTRPLHTIVFKEESEYAREVLKEACLNQNFPVLPIHDSFITTRKNTEKLEKIMNETSEKLFGYVLPYTIKF